MTSPRTIEAARDFIHDLRRAVPEAHFDRMTRLLYSTDASNYQMMPVGVAFPRSADEVSGAMEIAARHGVPVLPRGGGSSLAGQAVNHALILDLSRYMDRLIAIDSEARTVTVQPGAILGHVNRAAASYGLQFGPDPASADRATVGGVLGNNATGAHSIQYRMSVDHVDQVEAVLSDGSRVVFDRINRDWEARGKRPGLEGAIYRALPRILNTYAGAIATHYPATWRHVAGYNLNRLAGAAEPSVAHLLVGAEGTLGIITSATLKLVPRPVMTRLALVHFSTVRAALEATPVMLESSPSAVELIDRYMLNLTRGKREFTSMLNMIVGDPAIVLVTEFAGETEQELEAGIERLRHKLASLHHHDEVVIVSSPQQQAEVWHTRKAGLGILMSMPGDTKPLPFIEDAAVPVVHLAGYVERVHQIAREAGVEQVAMYAHASAGCLHIRPFINLKTSEGVRQLRQIAEAVVDVLLEYGGTTSGEHGEGISRGEFSARLFGPELTQAFREVKHLFDPQTLLNPGRVVDAPPMDSVELLRYGPAYSLPLEPRETAFAYEPYGSFGGAVEMCNGAGVCRKIDPGVMCPSYMATRDEAHSTRGRANALRAAMQGRLGPAGLTSDELYEVMDLCLSCKGCKAECPSSVDMAKLKAEFLHSYQQAHGVPLRARVFGHIAALYRLGQPAAPLTNLMLGALGGMLSRGLGIHPNRRVPRLAAQTFTRWRRQHRTRPRQEQPLHETRQVVFFYDTFMEYNDPRVGQAAIRVLEAAGYEVIVPDHPCCGRPMISRGLLDDAAQHARRNLAILAPYARAGLPIIGCEPSCVAMLVDEYPDLAPGPDARALAAQAMLFETFVMREIEAGHLSLKLNESPRQILVHGHCHQKALFGTGDMLAMLRLIPGCQVDLIESGCCGMAGSFGYEAEHYQLSIELAEMALAPTVRAAPPETVIAAPGTSCRDQIRDTTGREPLHPVEVLAAALKVT
ncbi:MAG: FAD-binding and (Fe-S)-binding domain-containing protein [Anaerolineae bacterium]